MSQKYGSRFLPSRIGISEYLQLKEELDQRPEIDCSFAYEKNDKILYSFDNIFIDCYILDENELPPVYILKRLSKLFQTENSSKVKFILIVCL